MDNYLFINNFILASINIFSILLVFWVYFSNKKEKINQNFSLMIISILFWIDSYHVASFFTENDLSLGLFKISTVSVFAFFIFYYFFIICFLNKKNLYKHFEKLVFIFGLSAGLLTISTGYIVPSIETREWGNLLIFSSVGRFIFYGYVIFLTILINILLLKNYFASSKKKKIKIQYFLVGFFIFAGLNSIFNVILPVFFMNYKFFQIGNYSTIFLVGFTAYAITKHNLMGIKTLIVQVLIAAISIVLIIDLLLLTDNMTMQLLKSGILAAFLYFSQGMVESVDKEKRARGELENTYRKVSKYVIELESMNIKLKEKNEDLGVLLEASDVIVGILDPKKIAQNVVDSIPASLNHLGYTGGILVLYDKNKKTVSTCAMTESALVKKAKKLLSKSFKNHSEPIKTNNLTTKTIKTKKMQTGSKLEDFIAPTVNANICKVIQKLVKARSFISIPIFSGGRIMGALIFVGVKPERKITQRDKDILSGFSSHVGPAIENAELYEKTDVQMKELGKLNKSMGEANQKLEELLEIKNEFLHITSHQLRTPLTAIRGMISLWYEGSFDNLSKEKRKKILKNIYVSTERLNNITNDMLDSIELEGGVFKFQFKQVSLEEVIRESINVLEFDFDKKGLYINFNVRSKDIPVIEAEPSYVRQIFLNLVDNACKYTNKGGVDIDIKKSGKYAIITIKDTGIGLSKDEQKTIFQKFTRGKEAVIKNAAGSGLGLFIARKVIKAHHGKIKFYSEGKGKGSTVKVHLPIKQE